MTPLIIFGTGGHAREIAQVVADINGMQPGTWRLLGFMADPVSTPVLKRPLPAPMLGGPLQVLKQYPDAQCIIAVGNSQARRRIVTQLSSERTNLQFATLVHPRAWLAGSVQLGQGSVVFAGSCINVDVQIGAHASINLCSTISHDCTLGQFVSISPGVHLPGGVTLGDAVEVGTGACFRPCIQVASDVVIGAGAAVVQDLEVSGTVVAGVPAKPMPT